MSNESPVLLNKETAEELNAQTEEKLPAKDKTSGQCECCASPLGDLVKLHGTKRMVCARCLGFMARWLIELEQPNQ